MNPWIMFASIAAVGLSAGLVFSLARMWRGTRAAGAVPAVDPSAGFSAGHYQVMERLLAPRDLEFLVSQPGFRPEMATNWKRESMRTFRMYLNDLTLDFHALHAQARQMVVASHTESPELAAILVRQKMAFFQARLRLEWRLRLYQCGASHVEVASIVDLVNSMQIDLTRLIPQAVPQPTGTV